MLDHVKIRGDDSFSAEIMDHWGILHVLKSTLAASAVLFVQKYSTIIFGRGTFLPGRHKIALNLSHGCHGNPGYHENVASATNFHTLAANFHKAPRNSVSETHRNPDGPFMPRVSRQACHSQVSQQHTLFLDSAVIFVRFASFLVWNKDCEMRVIFFDSKGAQPPVRLPHSAAFTSLLECTFLCTFCLGVCVRGRLLKS